MSQDRKYERHCGQLKEFDIESDRRFFRVTFKSNDRLDGTGFNATYRFLDEIEMYTTKTDPVNNSYKIGNDIYKIDILQLLLSLSVYRYCVVCGSCISPIAAIHKIE